MNKIIQLRSARGVGQPGACLLCNDTTAKGPSLRRRAELFVGQGTSLRGFAADMDGRMPNGVAAGPMPLLTMTCINFLDGDLRTVVVQYLWAIAPAVSVRALVRCRFPVLGGEG